jgi:hypothetical protein
MNKEEMKFKFKISHLTRYYFLEACHLYGDHVYVKVCLRIGSPIVKYGAAI